MSLLSLSLCVLFGLYRLPRQSSEPKEGKDAMGRGAGSVFQFPQQRATFSPASGAPSSPARGKETASEDSRTSQNLEEAHEEVHDEVGRRGGSLCTADLFLPQRKRAGGVEQGLPF